MVTYPSTLPTTPGIRNFNMKPLTAVGMNVSPFTYSQEVQVSQGQQWSAEFDLPPMLRSHAADWQGFMLGLNGSEGTFLMGDPDATEPLGTPTGTPVLDGNHDIGAREISIKGFTPNSTGNLLRGDVFQIGSGLSARLHRVVEGVDADGDGKATVGIWPLIRTGRADNDPIITSGAIGLWRLAPNTMAWQSNQIGHHEISVKCLEVVP
ncbi:hypothetical protein [Kiloniella majae]|uniref:hypothetical protein n=1 Tax=Kiloniella majae TaxID=1938558 RepID=UPI000A277A4C|nr:hypothetical protein [Kiloniella majae]